MKNVIRIIIIDDEDNIRKQIEDAVRAFLSKFRNAKYNPIFFSQIGSPILSLISENKDSINESDVAFIDYKLANDHLNGLQIAKILFEKNKNLSIVFVSGQADFIDIRRQDTGNIITFWIPKPISKETISNCFSSIIFKREATEKISELNTRIEFMVEQNLTGNQKIALKNGIVYASNKMNEIITTTIKIAKTDARVLITGANGTGKEGIAKMIHSLSNRSTNAFIAVNCAAIPSELIESELFGHEKGSFTTANQQRKGKFELANDGTLFLDEIGDMSSSAQAKVLRVLQENKITRVGGSLDIPVNVRIVAATNKNLEIEINENRFREDLFHRINVISIVLPSLEDRGPEDIKLLAKYKFARKCNDYSKNIKFEENALDALTNYNYPGNIRELENIIERAVLLSNGSINLENLKSFAPVLFSNKVTINENKTGKKNNLNVKTYYPHELSEIRNELISYEEKYNHLFNDFVEKYKTDKLLNEPTIQDLSKSLDHSYNFITERFTGTENIKEIRREKAGYLFYIEFSSFKLLKFRPFSKIFIDYKKNNSL